MVCSLVRFRSTALINEGMNTGAGKELSAYKTKGGMRRAQVLWQHGKDNKAR